MGLAALAAGVAALSPLAIGPAAAQPAPRTLRFVIIPKITHPWFDEVFRGAEQAALMIQSQAATTRVVRDYQPPAQALVEQQAAILQRAIAARPDGFSIDPLDDTRIAPLQQHARSQGIPLTVFDAESPKGLAIPSIGTDFCR